MTAFFEGPELLDRGISGTLGMLDTDAVGAIAGECEDALVTVLGPEVVDQLTRERSRVWVVAPWVHDLARGLQFFALHGSADAGTVALLRLFGSGRVREDEIERWAADIDVAYALLLGDVVEHVLGPGACARPAAANEQALPWLPAMQLGHRVHLVLEFLRLLASR